MESVLLIYNKARISSSCAEHVNCVKTTLLSPAKCNLLVPLQKKLDATKSKIVFNLTSFSISVMLVFAIVKVNWEQQNAEPFTLKVGNLTLKWVVSLHSVKTQKKYSLEKIS